MMHPSYSIISGRSNSEELRRVNFRRARAPGCLTRVKPRCRQPTPDCPGRPALLPTETRPKFAPQAGGSTTDFGLPSLDYPAFASRLTVMAPKHVVIVDDETAFRSMLRKTLEAAGYRVSEAKNALGVFNVGSYDLMLLDIAMPGIDGHKILTSLKADRTSPAPVLVVTGLSDPDLKQQVLDEGADGFFLKPVDKDRLLARIAELLARPPAR
jgi:CheY-like chemotaxis protein